MQDSYDREFRPAVWAGDFFLPIRQEVPLSAMRALSFIAYCCKNVIHAVVLFRRRAGDGGGRDDDPRFGRGARIRDPGGGGSAQRDDAPANGQARAGGRVEGNCVLHTADRLAEEHGSQWSI
jgi:hypothetical protein